MTLFQFESRSTLGTHADRICKECLNEESLVRTRQKKGEYLN